MNCAVKSLKTSATNANEVNVNERKIVCVE